MCSNAFSFVVNRANGTSPKLLVEPKPCDCFLLGAVYCKHCAKSQTLFTCIIRMTKKARGTVTADNNDAGGDAFFGDAGLGNSLIANPVKRILPESARRAGDFVRTEVWKRRKDSGVFCTRPWAYSQQRVGCGEALPEESTFCTLLHGEPDLTGDSTG